MKNSLSAVTLLLCLTFSVNAQEKHTTVNEQEKPTCQMHKKGRSKGNKKMTPKMGKTVMHSKQRTVRQVIKPAPRNIKCVVMSPKKQRKNVALQTNLAANPDF